MTFEKWEGFCAAEEEPYLWALYFDRDDNGLRGKIRPGTRVLDLELRRVEKRYTRDPALRQEEQTTAHAATEVERTNEGMPISPVILTAPGEQVEAEMEPQPLEPSQQTEEEKKHHSKRPEKLNLPGRLAEAPQRTPKTPRTPRTPRTPMGPIPETNERRSRPVSLTGRLIQAGEVRRIQGELILPRRVTPPQSPEIRSREPFSISPMSPMSPPAPISPFPLSPSGVPLPQTPLPPELQDLDGPSLSSQRTSQLRSPSGIQTRFSSISLESRALPDRLQAEPEQEEDCQSTSTDPRSLWSYQGGEETSASGTRSNGTYTPASSVHGDMPLPPQTVPPVPPLPAETGSKPDRPGDGPASLTSMGGTRSPRANPAIREETRESAPRGLPAHPRDRRANPIPRQRPQEPVRQSQPQSRTWATYDEVAPLHITNRATASEGSSSAGAHPSAEVADTGQYRHPTVEDVDEFDLD
jgi:hypothetical protein